MSLSSSPIYNRHADDTQVNLRQIIGNLQHQLSNVKAENQLLKLNESLLVDKYEEIITEKNQKIHKLEDDFTYLYKERDSLKSLLKNSRQIAETETNNLKAENDQLRKENQELKQDLDEVDESIYKLNQKYQKAKTELDIKVQLADDLDERISSLEKDNSDLLNYNDDLIKQLDAMSKHSSTNDMLHFNKNLTMKNESLQRINSQLQLKVDKLLQNKTSIELLRQKNLGLINSLNDYESLKENYSKLEIEKIQLENKFTEFKNLLKKSVGDSQNYSITEFLQRYNHLQNMNLVLEGKYNTCKRELNEYKTNVVEIEYQINNQLQPTIQNLQDERKFKQDLIDKLQNENKKHVREIDFLRNLLDKLQSIHLKNQKDIAVSKSTDEYLSNLEKSLEEYQKKFTSAESEIASLQTHIASLNAELNDSKASMDVDYSIGNKRLKIDDEYRRRSEVENSTIQNENIQLLSQIRDLNNTIEVLESKIRNLDDIESKQKELRVLQLRSNPFTKDQVIKQATLDALRQENQDLIDKFINDKETQDIPRAVFERQEIDKTNLQAKIDDLIKRNARLRENFTKKAKDIIQTISKFFGFSIEFIEGSIAGNQLGSKIKLISKYTIGDELKNSYIMLDMSSKTLKAYGNYDFKEFCQELMSEWANDKDQVPCILSALNIKLYQKYVLHV